MLEVALSSSARMDCIITFKILFKILGTLTLQAFLNEFMMYRFSFYVFELRLRDI